MRVLATLVTALGFAAAAQDATLPCAPGDRACAIAAARKHVVKQFAYWEPALARPVTERIGPAPPELIEFLTLDNLANSYPNRPRTPRLSAGFMADVRRAFDTLPVAVKRRLDAKLAGIYFVDDLGGTGFTDEIVGPAGEARAGFIVLDPSVLDPHDANGWATWKDTTPFKPAAGWKLHTRIEEDARNDRANAIQYILLHELGHVLSIGTDVHPRWTMSPKDVDPRHEYPYFQLSWRVEGGRYVAAPADEFAQRKDVVFYFGPRLAAESLPEVYSALERTSFPTLYAATHPGDDFAEAFASYVHVVMMGKPYEVRIEHEGRPVKRYTSCWSEPRCAAKRDFLERFLRR